MKEKQLFLHSAVGNLLKEFSSFKVEGYSNKQKNRLTIAHYKINN